MSGWGSGGWGTSAWGGGSGGAAITLLSALATSERTVQVSLSGEALALSPLLNGDALNPSTWEIVTLDSLGADDRTFIVLAVRVVAANTIMELYTLEKFSSYLVTHRVRSTTLLSEGRALVGLPSSADFLGVVAARPQQLGALTTRDLKNRPESGTTLTGALEMTSAGDYQTEEGVDLLRKLILRRLVTLPGEFFHLNPTGYGLSIRVKEPVSASDIPRMRTEIQRQIVQEPEVEACSATVNLDRRGILTVALKVRLKVSGLDVPLQFQIPTAITL